MEARELGEVKVSLRLRLDLGLRLGKDEFVRGVVRDSGLAVVRIGEGGSWVDRRWR